MNTACPNPNCPSHKYGHSEFAIHCMDCGKKLKRDPINPAVLDNMKKLILEDVPQGACSDEFHAALLDFSKEYCVHPARFCNLCGKNLS